MPNGKVKQSDTAVLVENFLQSLVELTKFPQGKKSFEKSVLQNRYSEKSCEFQVKTLQLFRKKYHVLG